MIGIVLCCVVACCTESQYDQFADSNLHSISPVLQSPVVLKTKGNSVDKSCTITSRDLELGPTTDSLPTVMKLDVKPLPENIHWREKHFQQTRQSYRALGCLFKVKILVLSLQV